MDYRNIVNGHRIPSRSYVDQPYIAILNDGSWLCVLTTGAGEEGDLGQHIVSIRSHDQGKSWSDPVAIEPSSGPEASFATPLHVPEFGGPLGRVYAFYGYNHDNLRRVIAGNAYSANRVDTLGSFVFRYTDDGGETWSAKRYEIPVREFDIDRENPYHGDIRFFWSVCKPTIANGRVFIGLHKVGSFGRGFMERSEGCFLASDNILVEPDPASIHWETLPDGRIGLRAILDDIADEQNIAVLSDGTLFCTYRTIDGHPCHAYSSDNGHTWTPPAHMTYGPGRRKVKHPRASNFVRKFANGRFLYWFHNHGDRSYDGRNPSWLLGGVEVDTPEGRRLTWSEPEIAIYDDDLESRISYPDFIEQGGKIFVTETQKTIARCHDLDPDVLKWLWAPTDRTGIAEDGLIAKIDKRDAASEVQMPELSTLWRSRGGFTFDFVVRFNSLTPFQLLFDSRDGSGRGISIWLTDRTTLRIDICGATWGANAQEYGKGLVAVNWECDAGLICAGRPIHATVIVDGGPKTICWVIDGAFNDGGEARSYGWSRFHPNLDIVNGAETARIAPTLDGKLSTLRIYDRALKMNEAAQNHTDMGLERSER